MFPNEEPLSEYKGHKIWIEIDEEDDCSKAFHIIKTPEGQRLTANITPYDSSVKVVKLFIDAGCPARGMRDNNPIGHFGNWDRLSLQKLIDANATV